MANFPTHLTGAVLAGITGAVAAGLLGAVPPVVCPVVLAVGVVGGLAPDVDSDHSRPTRLMFNTAMLVLPAALVWRVEPLHESAAVGVGAFLLLALFVRFPVRWAFAKLTQHRGMIHSIPAVGVMGCFVYLLAGKQDRSDSFQLAFGATAALGYLTHLALDELFAVDFNGKSMRLKSSLGSALDLWGRSLWPNLLAYGLLVGLGGLVYKDIQGRRIEDLWGDHISPHLKRPRTTQEKPAAAPTRSQLPGRRSTN